tara:strand:+ start:880 stop:2310 length:1431 start_codon:yes stop_codon:yes gene_type:complete
MSEEEKELSILRNAVDAIQAVQGRKKINNPDVSIIISIVEDFIRKKKRICYGGTAINNILPEKEQFYNKDIELPDYDFFSPTPLKDAKLLADLYFSRGFTEVVATAGVHTGTFKVFVNFMPVADITFLVPELYKNLLKKSSNVSGILYCPANYLRMLMYLELSRPQGDSSRWEKVLKRLTILNKVFPLEANNCDISLIQRIFEKGYKVQKSKDGGMIVEDNFKNIEEKIFMITRETLSGLDCVFFGAFANRLYLKNTKGLSKKPVPKIPDFDILADDPSKVATILKDSLVQSKIKNVKINKKPGVGDIIAPHYEVRVGGETVAFIYEPLGCHSFNVLKIGGNSYKIATLDTMLSFYLAFLFTDRPYYNEKRILCMSHYLFKVQQENRLKQKGLLKRFSMDCYGTQHSLEETRAEKNKTYKEFKKKNIRSGKKYEWHFLRYTPSKSKKSKKSKKGKKSKKVRKKGKRKTRKLFDNYL